MNYSTIDDDTRHLGCSGGLMPYRTGRVPLARRRLRSSAMILLAGASLYGITACTAGARDVAEPTPVVETTSPTTVASSTPTPAPTTPSTPPPLIPPSVVATAEPIPSVDYDVPALPPFATTEYVPAPPVDNGITTPSPAPPEPSMPPPNPVDSRGFPLGTTCGAVSCTSPDGVTFVNPDAVPNFGTQPFDQLCEQTICSPSFPLTPGLPSTGSAG
ncbi:hypothetical protein HQ346_10560 [Rhodococcus sp. BP-252]|uniref:hypothetical protein n=1 Tax=unclassified Rhodococcus (in: high G+C Gram-positive bacteria) TaxID=192944 RepID=UPI001C9BA8ED|nr:MULTISPECIES: hypothetical protein [unclassified Rhodococcus (in: high G+C Gram-positive bacteria)]MBY6412272.1 hypothetical protein [Rhodococcus sp. BP-320]MBY6416852.1 hypothetical protein [Rhodococcus sp. BP-321]MBY6421610.1 hypothetical protein [Rhodococcus sp. BP-324]MBY6426876.1 hypothetical protein [Rhodococcus sp. BP-323]MBY6432042.1 hypothetical protein [Rhodococcus sp. BP-322]